MRSMDHPNAVSLKHCFFSTTSRDELFLNLVMEYVPKTLYRVLKHYNNANQWMPLIYVKLYIGLAYVHTVPGVCHMDMKPQNVLVDPLTHQVKICDFGSAKVLAKCLETGETVTIKKVLQDHRYKNRELQLMRSMDHPNAVSLKHCFFSTTSRDELFLNLVMEYVPKTLYRVLKHYSNANQRMPLIYVKLYMYQLFRGLAYVHTVPGVCHMDVKPQSVLVDPLTHQVKICDFGSAKVLVR
ncbi:hypothetical protein ZWY2020_015640 [Hordeum vulgare]|nr:hypothetical protein ZWY2020_015640 [Hordeum vulgare]